MRVGATKYAPQQALSVVDSAFLRLRRVQRNRRYAALRTVLAGATRALQGCRVRFVRWIVSFAVVALFHGCQSDEIECTLVGGESFIGVQLPGQDWRVDQLCVDDECDSPEIRDQPHTYRFRLSVFDPAGVQIVLQGNVTTGSFYPNGNRCEPELAVATIMVADDGTFSIQTDAPY